jgi:hypothetical protein
MLSRLRPDGTPWHTSEADNTAVVLGGLFGLALGNPGLGVSMGSAIATPGGEPLAPAPYVVLKVTGRTYRISPADRTYAPVWQQPIIVDTSGIPQSEQVLVQVVDGVDDALIAQQAYTVADFFSPGARTLVNVGPIASLDLEVTSHPPRQRQEFEVHVPGNLSLHELVGGQASTWSAIPVWNGDTISIQADGIVCPSSMSSDCVGPDGAEGRWRSYNYDEFKEVPHAALIALLPGAAHHVGSASRLRAEQSGQLLLFVNDTDVGNNRGSFLVHVTVDPQPGGR